MSNFHIIRTAASLSLIVALTIQPAAALGGGGIYSAASEGLSACQGCGCCESDRGSCCSGGETATAGSREELCCGHAKAAESSHRKSELLRSDESVSSGGQLDRACACGQLSQPLSDSSPRSSTGSKRVDIHVAFAMRIAADDHGHCGNAGRVGIDQPSSPERFSQRNLCVWRL